MSETTVQAPPAPSGGFFTSRLFAWLMLGVMVLAAAAVIATGRLETTPPSHRIIIVATWSAAVLLLALRLGFARLLTSVRFGVALLAVLMLGAVAGTFIEQLWDTPRAQRYVYHAWWYIAVMALLPLTLNAACWPHYKAAWRLRAATPLRRRERAMEGLPEGREIKTDATPEQVEAVLAKHLGWVHREDSALYARRGLIQRSGFIITHIGITLLMAGSIVLSVAANIHGPPGSRSIWIGEGIETDRVRVPERDEHGHETGWFRMERLPFSVKLHDFDAEMFARSGVPRFFGSLVEIIPHDGRPNQMFQITMNEALRWEGWKFSQNSYILLDEGLAEEQAQSFTRFDGEAFVSLLRDGRMEIDLRDNLSGRRFPKFDAGVGTRVEVPQSGGLFFETMDGQTFQLLRGPEVVGEGALLRGEQASPVPSEPYTARVTGRMTGAYSILGVMEESKGIKAFFFVSFFLFGLGPFIAFTRGFDQVWAWVDPAGGRVLLGGRARGLKAGLPKLLDRIANDLETQRA